MKIKTSELTGAALDWAVAKCEGAEITFSKGLQATPLGMPSGQWEMYSTNWAQGGPIIERELTKVFRNVGGKWSAMILKEVPIPPRRSWNKPRLDPACAVERSRHHPTHRRHALLCDQQAG